MYELRHASRGLGSNRSGIGIVALEYKMQHKKHQETFPSQVGKRTQEMETGIPATRADASKKSAPALAGGGTSPVEE